MPETPKPTLPIEVDLHAAPASARPAAAVPSTEVDPHVTIRVDRPVDVRFSFEHTQPKVGVTASVVSHIVLAVIAFLVMRYTPEAQSLPPEPDKMPADIVWLAEPGPGGGGGGGGTKNPEPPKKAELPGKEKITVPVEKKPEPAPPKEEPPPVEAPMIPAKSMASTEQTLAGVIKSEAPVTVSQGTGSGGGAGTGTGSGIGPGTGSGLGPGWGGGQGGGAYRPGSGVTVPVPLKEVKPLYTADAMRAKVQGTVWLECIVMPDGTVGDVRVTKSLDSVFGLDQEAIKAARQWRFRPGTRQGEPVPVIVTIELTFTLR
jgi:TonB family protein